jgi:hypothetical protein
VHWAGAVSLLRAVGHVLKNVDQATHQRVNQSAETAFKRWMSDDPEHAVFRQFILSERNNILKRYEPSTYGSGVISVVMSSDVGHVSGEILSCADEIMTIEENFFRPIIDGYGAGEDARDVFEKALSWWERELSEIEAAAGLKG